MSEWQCDTCIYKKDNMSGGPTCPEFSFFWKCITDISDGKQEQTGHCDSYKPMPGSEEYFKAGHCKRIIPKGELE